jgi:hypothetical protein
MHGVLWPIILKMSEGSPEKWDHFVGAAVFAINARRHTVTGYSPFFLVYGMEPRLPGDLSPPFVYDFNNSDDRFSFTQRELINLGQARAASFLRSEKQAKKMEEQHRKNNEIKPHSFTIGEFVKIKNNAKTKFDEVFKGPLLISDIGPNDSYYIKTPSGLELKSPVNHCYIEPYVTAEMYRASSGLVPESNEGGTDIV